MVTKRAYVGILVCLIFSMSCEGAAHLEEEEVEADSGVWSAEQDCTTGEDGCQQLDFVSERPTVTPEHSSASCPGYKTHDNFPKAYEEFCQEMVTQDLLGTGDTCFFAPVPEKAGCFCKICALKGPTVQCVSEECN